MTTKTEEVDFERQRKAFETVVVALKECSEEERRRVLASCAVLFGDDDDIAERIERNRRTWR